MVLNLKIGAVWTIARKPHGNCFVRENAPIHISTNTILSARHVADGMKVMTANHVVTAKGKLLLKLHYIKYARFAELILLATRRDVQRNVTKKTQGGKQGITIRQDSTAR